VQKSLLTVLVVLTVAAGAFGFGNQDQGMVTADKVVVLEVPNFYPAVDAHTHVGSSEESFDTAINAMDAAGVACSVNLSGGSGENLDRALAGAAKYPGRFVTFCGVSARGDEWKAPDIGEKFAQQIQQAHDKGAAGFGEIVKWTLFSRIDWDDPRLEPVWNKLEELKMPINWHVGDPSRYWRPQGPYNTLESNGYMTGFPSKQECLFKQEHVLEKHPNLIVIAAHSNYLADQVPYLMYRFQKYPNYYIDLSATCGEWGRVPEEFVDICKMYPDRILYGTDAGYRGGRTEEPVDMDTVVRNFKAFQVAHFLFYGTRQRGIPIPWNGNYGKYITHWENGFTRYAHDGVNLPDDILRKIYYQNAERLFGIKVADWKPAEGFTYKMGTEDLQPRERGGANEPPAGRRRPPATEAPAPAPAN